MVILSVSKMTFILEKSCLLHTVVYLYKNVPRMKFVSAGNHIVQIDRDFCPTVKVCAIINFSECDFQHVDYTGRSFCLDVSKLKAKCLFNNNEVVDLYLPEDSYLVSEKDGTFRLSRGRIFEPLVHIKDLGPEIAKFF